MIVEYLFSSPEGDLAADEVTLARPFLLSPSESHPFLCLRDYFNAIRHFVLRQRDQLAMRLLGEGSGASPGSEEIERVIIRSEKHGALYHIASVEVFSAGSRAKFAVSTAISENSQKWLALEFETLTLLNDTYYLPYLPQVYFLDTLKWETPGGVETLAFMLSEWFEDYHEWHLSGSDSGETCAIIWDLQRGYRRAEEKEIYEIYLQASRILTLYYGVKSSHLIYPWQHAAGDFVVKSANGVIDVRLTTARQYGPLVIFLEERDTNPLMALLYFFLDLTLRMRVDRWEGVGRVVWAEDLCVGATVEGFFQALRVMEEEGRYDMGRVDDLSSLLKTFRHEEIRRLCIHLFEFYRKEGGEMLSVIEKQLEDHCRSLCDVIRSFPG